MTLHGWLLWPLQYIEELIVREYLNYIPLMFVKHYFYK